MERGGQTPPGGHPPPSPPQPKAADRPAAARSGMCHVPHDINEPINEPINESHVSHIMNHSITRHGCVTCHTQSITQSMNESRVSHIMNPSVTIASRPSPSLREITAASSGAAVAGGGGGGVVGGGGGLLWGLYVMCEFFFVWSCLKIPPLPTSFAANAAAASAIAAG